MNVLVDFFRCFSLVVLVVSSSVKIKVIGEDDDENEYARAVSDYEKFRIVHDLPEMSRDELHNASQMKQDTKGNVPHQNLGVHTSFGSFVSHMKPHPGQKEKTQTKFNNLLCLTDCRMVDLMVFNLRNQPGNSSFQFQNMALAGRPYSFASLKTWCQDNCGKKPGSGSNEKDLDEFGDGEPAGSNPFLSFDVKPSGLVPPIPPIPPVIPTIFFPSVRNFYPFSNIIATPFLYRARKDRRTENTPKTSGVSFRSLRDNSPRVASRMGNFPRPMHHKSKFKARPYPSVADYNAFMKSRELGSDAQIPEKERPQQQTNAVTKKNDEETIHSEDSDNDEDTDVEEDYDDEEAEDGKMDSVVRFLREVSRILSHKAFRVLLKRSSCDSRRNLPGKAENTTHFHGRGLH